MNKKFNTAVIFAGGKSSRMGKDKALLPFKGYATLAEYQYNKLSKLFNKVYISAKSNKFNFDINIIEDCYKTSSPLVGLVSIFETIDTDEIFVLSVDAPFVDNSIIEKLYSNALSSKDIIVALSPNGLEPLCAIYRKTILPIAKKFLKENNHRLYSLIKSLDSQFIEFNSKEHFINLNTPQDYRDAFKRIII